MNPIASFILVAAVSYQARAAMAETQSTSTLYKIVNGHVVFPEWDNRPEEPKVLREIGIDDFPDGFVYRDRLLLSEGGAVLSRPIEIPEDATTISITARSRPAGDVFSRMRISLIADDKSEQLLFNGYWQTVSLETYYWTLDKTSHGQKMRLRLEMLNPGLVEEERTWYFLRANIY